MHGGNAQLGAFLNQHVLPRALGQAHKEPQLRFEPGLLLLTHANEFHDEPFAIELNDGRPGLAAPAIEDDQLVASAQPPRAGGVTGFVWAEGQPRPGEALGMAAHGHRHIIGHPRGPGNEVAARSGRCRMEGANIPLPSDTATQLVDPAALAQQPTTPPPGGPTIDSAISDIDRQLAALETLLTDNPPVADEVVAAADAALATLTRDQAAAGTGPPKVAGEDFDGPRSAPPDWVTEAAREIGREPVSVNIPDGQPAGSAEGAETPAALPGGESEPARPALLRRVARLPLLVLEIIDLPFAGLGSSVKAVIGSVAIGTLLLAVGLLVAGSRLTGATASYSAPREGVVHDAPSAAPYNGGNGNH